MKNSIYILIFVTLFTSCQEKQKTAIDKPIVELSSTDKIPSTAFWIENNGKGNWFNVEWIHNHKNNAQISVFDKKGELILKSKFVLVCAGEGKLIEDLKKEIDYFDGEDIQLKVNNCYLMKR